MTLFETAYAAWRAAEADAANRPDDASDELEEQQATACARAFDAVLAAPAATLAECARKVELAIEDESNIGELRVLLEDFTRLAA